MRQACSLIQDMLEVLHHQHSIHSLEETTLLQCLMMMLKEHSNHNQMNSQVWSMNSMMMNMMMMERKQVLMTQIRTNRCRCYYFLMMNLKTCIRHHRDY